MSNKENKAPCKCKDPAKEYLNQKFSSVPCEHVWEYVGHGHNDSHYICRKCGSEGDY